MKNQVIIRHTVNGKYHVVLNGKLVDRFESLVDANYLAHILVAVHTASITHDISRVVA